MFIQRCLDLCIDRTPEPLWTCPRQCHAGEKQQHSSVVSHLWRHLILVLITYNWKFFIILAFPIRQYPFLFSQLNVHCNICDETEGTNCDKFTITKSYWYNICLSVLPVAMKTIWCSWPMLATSATPKCSSATPMGKAAILTRSSSSRGNCGCHLNFCGCFD